MQVLVLVATFLGGASARLSQSDVRAAFDAVVNEAQLPPGVQAPPGWVVINTGPKPPPVSVPSVAKVAQTPPVPNSLVAAGQQQHEQQKVQSAQQQQQKKTDPAKEPAPAPASEKESASAPASEKESASAPASEKESASAPASEKESAPAPAVEQASAPAPAPIAAPMASPAGPAGAPGPADVYADELSGPHQQSIEDDYVPAMEGAFAPPTGEEAADTSGQALVPPRTLSKIRSVECLEKSLEDPGYQCADHHYAGDTPPRAVIQQKSETSNSGDSTAADMLAINEAVKKAEAHAAHAKEDTQIAKKYFNDAKEIAEKLEKAEQVSESEDAASSSVSSSSVAGDHAPLDSFGEGKPLDSFGQGSAGTSFLRHPLKHHREHHEVFN